MIDTACASSKIRSGSFEVSLRTRFARFALGDCNKTYKADGFWSSEYAALYFESETGPSGFVYRLKSKEKILDIRTVIHNICYSIL